MWHMFSIQFLKSYLILKIFFQNFRFWSLNPLFVKKTQNFAFFWKCSFRACGTCFYLFFKLISNLKLNYFFKKFVFWSLYFPFLKKLNFLNYFLKIVFSSWFGNCSKISIFWRLVLKISHSATPRAIFYFLKSMISWSLTQYKQYRTVNTEDLVILTPLPSDIKLGNHPSWNIPHIPRAGAASGLNRPSGCVGYFTRDDFLIWYCKILHSATPRAIFQNIGWYFWLGLWPLQKYHQKYCPILVVAALISLDLLY